MSRRKDPVARARAALLEFYDAHARDLPWRRTRDPYAIWVSEIMLQQTRVDTVVRYYDRFLARFPTAHALASASEDDVLAAWSGLGYYRRARLLHTGVREVVARYGGQVPQDAEARRELPGIGRYTAGAIGSIAFDLPEPIVDGNVARVLSRVHAIDTPLGRADTEARLWEEAEKLSQGPRPGALNQALMELGATLCSKSAPRCNECPLRDACKAHAEGRADELPIARKKTPAKPVALVALLVVDARGHRVGLLRGEGELFGGLWNLPMREGRGVADARALLDELQVTARVAEKPIGRIEHVLSHRNLRIQLFRALLGAGRAERSGKLRMTERAALHELGISSLTRKALSQLEPGPAAAAVAPRPRT
ncbi:MAG TPA: A/G-specific adenine glycosylase [Polyangiales bacterium]|nr:A/G-specific adenine glycosylase [Polyangiales bacterium]